MSWLAGIQSWFSSHFINALSGLQWALLAAVPPAIVLLYFLKLKRQPVEVPSTYLWSRTIEDLHVNSIWQRLRQSLLLFLQLLLILLVILACFRPGWRGDDEIGERTIFLIDSSASMGAVDVEPTRLDDAKRRVLELIDQMDSGDVAMVISFSDRAIVEQSFTDNRSLLRQKVNRIKATNHRSDLSEALRAASGLANPGRTSQSGTNDVQVAEALPATLYIYSDGGFSAVPNFSLGNLEPKFIPIGSDAPDNLAVVAFTADRNPEKPGAAQAYARLQNSGGLDVEAEVSLYLNDTLADASNIKVPADGEAGVQFELQNVDDGVLRLEIGTKDHLALDDHAYVALGVPRRARVLVVTAGHNDAMRLAMTTDQAVKIAELAFAEPAVLMSKEHQDLVASGAYDFIIYEQCAPVKMPQASTLFIGSVPPLPDWSLGARAERPIIIDIDRAHPLTQLVEMGNVAISEGTPVKGPSGATTLFDSDAGPLFVVAGREGFDDAVLGFEIVGTDDKGAQVAKTDWIVRRSFPVFVMNALRYLGGNRGALALGSVSPGTSITLRSILPVDKMRVESPSGQTFDVAREGQNAFVFTRTDEVGIYKVRDAGAKDVSQQFAVNLFDARESNLDTTQEIKLGAESVTAKANAEPVRREFWKWLLLVGLGVLLFEWYVYNRRVYF